MLCLLSYAPDGPETAWDTRAREGDNIRRDPEPGQSYG